MNTVTLKFIISGNILDFLEQALRRAQIANHWTEPLYSTRKTWHIVALCPPWTPTNETVPAGSGQSGNAMLSMEIIYSTDIVKVSLCLNLPEGITLIYHRRHIILASDSVVK
jgi:hypothetical protein